MSFDSKKNLYGERLTSGVAIYPNCCKYSTPEAFAKSIITVDAIPYNTFGYIATSGGDIEFFENSTPYLRVDDEIIEVTFTSPTNITITGRGMFGTANVSHDAGDAKIIHGGEADGSCVGYPKRPDGGGCSTPDSFDRDAEREFLFIDGQSFDGQVYYNGLKSLSHNPCEVKPGESMAKNASQQIIISDNTDDDVYSVPYPDRRTSKATLFKKLLARTGGYLQNRRAIVYTGFELNGNFNKESCIAREYLIDTISLNNSQLSLKLIDPLMLAEAAKAKIPEVSGGKLLSQITDASTNILLKDFIDGEYGINTDEITVKIDSELIDCTIIDSATGELAIVNRSVAGSESKDHSVNASVQLVKVLTNYNPIEEIISALQTTSIPSRFYGDYSSVIAATTNATGPVYIYNPKSVESYINTIIKTWSQSNITMYFDERTQLITIKAVGDFEQQPLTLTYKEDIKQESLNIKQNYSSQYTRASIGFAPFNAAKKTDEDNAGILYQSINLITEATGTLEPQSAGAFYTQFLSNSDTDVQIAVSGAARTANLNKKAPEIFTFKVDYSNYGAVTGGLIEEGEIISVTTDATVDDYGEPKANNLQILSLKDNYSEATYTVKAISYQDIINEEDYDFIIDEDKTDYDLSTEFAPAEAGEYKVFVASGTVFGATSTSLDAFTTGAQAAGVTFYFVFRCGILGAGGKGGDASDAILEGVGSIINDGVSGENGGDALNLTVPCTIDISQGLIFSGGGGAPSSVTEAYYDEGDINSFVTAGNGGSGGQGFVGGLGGRGSEARNDGESEYGPDGVDGTRAAAGVLGDIYGGSYGEGSNSGIDTGGASLPGFAIKSNGNTITIIGDNDLTIKGRRDY